MFQSRKLASRLERSKHAREEQMMSEMVESRLRGGLEDTLRTLLLL